MFWKIIGSMIAGAATILFGSTTFATGFDTSACTYETFKVTAYYSPKVQDFYYRGNLGDEIILNGKGTHGASGAPVYRGMLAAPGSYAFGTKIYFPGGRGVGKVDDRGGAILNKGERADATETRIDIRAGEGEEGLIRALSFGVQYLNGWVCPEWAIPDSEVGINYDNFPQYEDFFHASLWIVSLRPDRQDARVSALQNYLIALGYLGEGRNTGYYGRETKAAVCKYQQDYLGLAASRDGCGYFGPQTRYDMKLRVKQRGISNLYGPVGAIIHNNPQADEAPEVQDILLRNAGEVVITEPAKEPETLDDRIIEHLFTKGEFKNYKFIDPLKRGDERKVVRVLQRWLQWKGYLDHSMPISGVYDMDTIQAVYQFQLDMGIVTRRDDPNVHGFFGPKTREVINSL